MAQGDVMTMRLEPTDEMMHAPGGESNFNESMYFNVFDPTPRGPAAPSSRAVVGGWFRVGNRPNEGYAEVTVCLYLPDGTVGFIFSRPRIDSNDAFDAAGLRFQVIEPFKELSLDYRGPVALLTDPLAMKDPATAFAGARQVDCEAALTFRGLSPMWGGEPVAADGAESGGEPSSAMTSQFARGHYEQHVGASGRLAVDQQTWEIDGYGLRDHSWGPRWWQTPWWYRWLTANAGPQAGFMVSVITGRDGQARRGGVVFENGAYTPITGVELKSEWATSDRYHDRISCVISTPERQIQIDGRVLSLVPLRNRRGEELTRISEGLTEWTWEGRTGYGMSEYLDQIVDGLPVGLEGC